MADTRIKGSIKDVVKFVVANPDGVTVNQVGEKFNIAYPTAFKKLGDAIKAGSIVRPEGQESPYRYFPAKPKAEPKAQAQPAEKPKAAEVVQVPVIEQPVEAPKKVQTLEEALMANEEVTQCVRQLVNRVSASTAEAVSNAVAKMIDDAIRPVVEKSVKTKVELAVLRVLPDVINSIQVPALRTTAKTGTLTTAKEGA